jgi:hypothetical protein
MSTTIGAGASAPADSFVPGVASPPTGLIESQAPRCPAVSD